MGRFEGKTVLISGGGSGLGYGLIGSFLDEGATVGTLEVSEEKVALLRKDYPGDALVAVHGDVRSVEDNAQAVKETVGAFGRLDSFIQCAGITDWTPAFSLLANDTLPEAFDEILRVNVLGTVLGAKAAVEELRKTQGSITLTLSTSGFFPGGQGAIYTLSKHALVGLVRQLAYELAPTVRVNAVVPGAIQESRIGGPAVLGQADLYPEAVVPDFGGLVESMTPLHVYPKASEYAGIYQLLADPERGRLATGSIVFWDGGISLIGHGTGVMDALQSGQL